MLVNFFCNTIMTTESTCSYHFTKKKLYQHLNAPQQSIMHWRVRWPSRFVCSYAPFITQRCKCTSNFSAWIQSLQKMLAKVNESRNTPQQSIMHWKCGDHYASFLAVHRSLHNITDEYQLLCNESMSLQKSQWEAILCYCRSTPCGASKKNWNKGVVPWCLLHSCCSWRKGTFQNKAMSSSKEIKPVALSIVKLCLAEGIS